VEFLPIKCKVLSSNPSTVLSQKRKGSRDWTPVKRSFSSPLARFVGDICYKKTE
jgi:hypothetical protein